MDWSNEPATDQQLACLSQFGYLPERKLTKGEASQIIHEFREKAQAAQAQGDSQTAPPQVRVLREEIETARRTVAAAAEGQREKCQSALAAALAKREEFWLDTCREVTQMHARSPQVLELYKNEGCRFVTPTHEHVQEILQALDTIMPAWDEDHPELFYQTLELNFPELLRHP